MRINGQDPLGRLKGLLDRVDESERSHPTPRRDRLESNNDQLRRPEGGADAVALSPQAEELRRTREAIENSPEVREDLVRQLKREIASGRYRIDGSRIADGLLGERHHHARLDNEA